jgi:magnesium chelatase subunit H
MEPSRPTALVGIIERMNAEPELPLRILLHAHESAELTSGGRCDAIGERIRRSDLVIVSHVMLDEEVRALEKLVPENLDSSATVVVISSAAPLMRLTRVGKFVMKSKRGDRKRVDRNGHDGTKSVSVVKRLLKRMTDGRNIAPYLKDMMVLAPKLLRLIPGRMRDLRSYVEAYLYSIEISDRNVRSMLLMLADRYHGPLEGKLAGHYQPPVIYPPEGIYHPDASTLFDSREEYLRWYHDRRQDISRHRQDADATIGLLLLRGNVIAGETGYIDRTIRAFEERGIGVVAAFAGSFDYRIAVERMMLDRELCGIDALVSLTAFPLVGGHVRSESARSVEALERYGVPYFSPVPLLFQTVEEWRESDYGLNPVQTALHIALPELDGAIEPLITSGVTSGESGKIKVTIEERTGRLVDRVERWIALRQHANAGKRIAITIFSFPPSKGSVGTAAYLDVFRSAFNTLVQLKEEGYTVELPASHLEMIEQIVVGDDKLAALNAAEIAIGASMEVGEYEAMASQSERVTRMWGAPPGTLNSDGRRVHIHGRRYGNIFVGVQPSFGFEGDPMRLLFAKNATPHHGFLAYYTWIEKVFRADAHLHFGTHGALEFMPGKQAGLSDDCWPDILIGELPNIYLYSINNPSEGTIAKRRALATLVSYLTPPLENAGLYRELSTLKSMVADYRLAAESDPRRSLTVEALIEKVDQLHLDKDVPLPSTVSQHDMFIAKLHAHLMEIESRLIPTGLHVVGEAPSREELADLLLAVGEYDRPEQNVRSLTGIIAGALNVEYHDLYRQAESGDDEAMSLYTAIRRTAQHGIRSLLSIERNDDAVKSAVEVIHLEIKPARPDLTRLGESLRYLLSTAERAVEQRELRGLLDALSGRYISAAVGSDPVRVPEALPSGRNIHSLDPSSVPSPVAIRNAKRVVDLMLARNHEETGSYPKSIGMILWGLDNIKTQGEAIAQAFALIGIEPVVDSIGRVSRLEVVPLEKLGRPRIDVTMQASGICRDIFGLQLELLDEAVRLAASLDEPEEMNFVRQRSKSVAERLGISIDEASARIFSNSAGSYGTNVDYMVGMSAWKNREDLAEVFLRRKSFAYGRKLKSHESRRLLEELASEIDTTFQNLDSSEVGITDVDHYFEYLGGFTNVVALKRGRRPTVLVADTTTARAKVRTLEATIRLEARTKLLNPKWFEGMMRHGYQGVEEIRKRLDYTFGFSATAEAVDSWVYESVHATYVADPAMREEMTKLNPHAYAGILRRLLESHDRGFWSVDDERVDELRELAGLLEDRLEGIE